MYHISDIAVHAVESKIGPRLAFFKVKTGTIVSFLFVFKCSSFCRKMRFYKDNGPNKYYKLTIFMSKTGPIVLRNMLGPIFDLCLDHCLPFWVVLIFVETTIYSCFFSTILHVLSPHQKIGNTFCEHNCANWKNILGCDLHFWFMGCLQCYLTNVLMGVKNNKNSKITNKQEPDNKILARNHPILCFQKETDNTYVNHSNFTSKGTNNPTRLPKTKTLLRKKTF